MYHCLKEAMDRKETKKRMTENKQYQQEHGILTHRSPLGTEMLTRNEQKVQSFFDYVCLLVLSGQSGEMQFVSSIWDWLPEIEEILKS